MIVSSVHTVALDPSKLSGVSSFLRGGGEGWGGQLVQLCQ